MITGEEKLNLVLMLTPKTNVKEIPQMLREFADEMESDIDRWSQFDSNMTDTNKGIEYEFVDECIDSLAQFVN